MVNKMILLTINLKGNLSSNIKHTESQTVKVDATPLHSKHPVILEKSIRHNDRQLQPCCRKMRFSDETVNYFRNSECPTWEKAHNWKNYSKTQKLKSHLNRFDEGFGYSYEVVD